MEVFLVVLLYGLEKWVMTPYIRGVLDGFQHRVAQRLTGRQPQRGWDGGWVYHPLTEAMAEAGLQEVDTYVYFSQNTFTQLIATRPIMDLCLAVEMRLGSWVAKRWQEQDGFELEGM